MALSIPIISEFDGKGINKAIAEFKQLEGAGAKTGFALKKAMVPAIAVLGGLAAGLGLATKAAVEDQKAQDLLALALENTTGGTKDGAAELEKFISATSMSAAVTDDELRPAMANLLRGTHDVERAQVLMASALDVSAATGKDLESVTIAMSKAENGQLDALKKLGIPLGENSKALKEKAKLTKEVAKYTQDLSGVQLDLSNGFIDAEKAAEQSNKINEKLAKTNAELAEVTARAGDFTLDLSTQFGGAAATAANSFEGQMKGLKIAMDETKESIGAALLPVLLKLLELLQPVAKFAQENTKLFLIITGVIGGFAAAIIAANIAIKVFTIATQIASAAQTVFNFIMSANPIALVIIAIAAFVAALVLLYKRFEVVREVVDTVFKAIKTGVTTSLDFLTSYFTGVLNIYKGIFNEIAKLWNNSVGKLSFKFPDWVPGFGGQKISVPQIPMLADGGIVTRPTLAMVGERGPEAIVPLSRGGGVGGITVNVTGGLSTSAEIGQAVVNAIRAYNRSAGPAQIQVA